MSKQSVSVTIGGQEYRVVSDDEEGLQQVAGYVDDAMRRIRERTGTVDSLDVAVLTALNFAREILSSREVLGARGPVVEDHRLRALIELAESVELASGDSDPAAQSREARAAGA